MRSFRLSIVLFFMVCLVGQACTSQQISSEKIHSETTIESAIAPITPTESLTESLPFLDQITLQPENPLCEVEQAGSTFSLGCEDGALSIQQNENRQGVDLLLQRMLPASYNTPFTLEGTITSLPAAGSEMDENQYGILLLDASGVEYAIRFQGSYFDLETWSQGQEIKRTTLYNTSYSPFFKTEGQPNQIQLTCTDEICDLFINEEFSGRFPIDLSGEIVEVGIFTASAWDEQFGQVSFQDFSIGITKNTAFQSSLFEIEDDLRTDHATFSQSGLSGAFNSFMEDGFHFSPLIPYKYYSAKANPSLADVAVSAVVHMKIDPSSSSSRYAGLVCRSSQDGMYMAVIRADGTYSIFRDTPQRPFALLAERKSDAILSGTTNNSLKLECIGNQINFYINGTQVEALTDTRYGLHFGRSGLFTKAGGEPAPDAIIFRDLVIEEIRK